MFDPRVFRREKSSPNEDAWRVLRVGVCIGLVLFVVLPLTIG